MKSDLKEILQLRKRSALPELSLSIILKIVSKLDLFLYSVATTLLAAWTVCKRDRYRNKYLNQRPDKRDRQ